jgi:FkbM family methyltransferase
MLLDIGAHDGVTLSNTYLLYSKYGWRGTYVEPDARNFAKLCENVPLGMHLNVAIKPGASATVPLWQCTDGLYTTLSEINKSKWAKLGFAEPVLVQALSVQQLLQLIATPSLVSIDTEGTSHEIFKALRGLLQPTAWVVEVDNMSQRVEVDLWAKANRYDVALSTPENLVLVKQ